VPKCVDEEKLFLIVTQALSEGNARIDARNVSMTTEAGGFGTDLYKTRRILLQVQRTAASAARQS
jgi:hypothetical protein